MVERDFLLPVFCIVVIYRDTSFFLDGFSLNWSFSVILEKKTYRPVPVIVPVERGYID